MAEGVTKRFGPTVALAGVDLGVAPGEIVALVGPNGAGKSTLLRILATSVVPDSGTVRIAGVDALASPVAARRHTGVVTGEDRSFFWRLSGRQNLEFFAALHGLRRREAAVAAAATLAAVGLGEVADRRVDRYSSGMRSRLGVARALLGDPAVLLLDEPSRSLDPEAAERLRQLVAAFATTRPAAVVMATHDLAEASAVATRVVVLEQGRVRAHLAGGDGTAGLAAVLAGAGT